MKTTFSAYLRPTEEEFSNLWSNCFFTFDTNILLNLYRYKDETKDEFIKIFKHKKFKDCIFLTHKVCLEYMKNRTSVISEQADTYKKLINEIKESVITPLSNKSKHPHISDQLLSELNVVITKLNEEATQKIEDINTKYSVDAVLNSLLELFESKISKKFDDEELKKLYKDGEERYSNNIPPGYRDNKKPGEEKYGDLLIWKQIISYINTLTEKKDVIIVTDDVKEDWWLNHKGMKVPHPLLIEEFYKETGKKVYFYTSDMFYKYASERINKTVNQGVIDDVVEVREEIGALQKSYYDNPSHNFEIITEEELLTKLKAFNGIVTKNGGYIGLKKFVTEFLANQEYEINHTYAKINSLVEQNLISISTKFDDSLNYNVKVVEIIDGTVKTN